MSRKMIDIQNDYNDLSSSIGSANLNPIADEDPGSVDHETYNKSITVYNNGHEEKVDYVEEKWIYNGFPYSNSYDAYKARDSVIKAKMAAVEAKIAQCESFQSKISTLKSDCTTSMAALKTDVATLGSAQSAYDGFVADIESGVNSYNAAVESLQGAFKCQPTTLMTNTGSRIKGGFDTSAISGAKSTLDNYIQMGQSVLDGLSRSESNIDEFRSKLNAQLGRLRNMLVLSR